VRGPLRLAHNAKRALQSSELEDRLRRIGQQRISVASRLARIGVFCGRGPCVSRDVKPCQSSVRVDGRAP
jgi:hypothetical protein